MTLVVADLGRCDFRRALKRMNVLVERIWKGLDQEHLILFESDPVITLGRHTQSSSLLVSGSELGGLGIDLMRVNRGGDVTWHGPGQLIVFPLINVRLRDWNVYQLIDKLIEAIAETLEAFGVRADPPGEEIGVWVGGDKIANIGLWHERGIVSHGLSFNVNPEFDWTNFIKPCGDESRRVTSLERLVRECPPMDTVKRILTDRLRRQLVPTISPEPARERKWQTTTW